MNTVITAYGASTAPDAVNTSAIQAAIDTCTEAGGGRVVCPPGVWRTGSLWMKSNVTLYLEAGCTLLASPKREDYNIEPATPESASFQFENVTDHHLILAYQADTIAIEGDGTIDGNSSAFLDFNGKSKWVRNFDWRPGQMIYFCRCTRVRVRNTTLNNAPYWTLFLHGCEDVAVDGVTIYNPDNTPNGDGIDIDCCRNVHISNCTVSSGDDSITLRAHSDPLMDPIPCENVTVENCVLRSACNAIRVGVGNGIVRNCVFSNIVINDSRMGINVVSRYTTKLPGSGATIRNIRFNNMIVEAVRPFFITTGEDGAAPVENLTFTGMTVTGSIPSFIGGMPDNPVSNCRFRDMTWNMNAEEEKEDTSAATVPNASEDETLPMQMPAAFSICHASEITFEDVRLDWLNDNGPWQFGIACRNSRRLTFHKLDAAIPMSTSVVAIRCYECSDITIRDCRARQQTAAFYQVLNPISENIVRVIGNDFSALEKAGESSGRVTEIASGNLVFAQLPGDC